MAEKSKIKKKKGNRILNVTIVLIFLTGAVVLLYPTISNIWNQYRNLKLISDYSSVVAEIDNDEYDEIMRLAREYNEQHTVNNLVDAFGDEEDYILSHPYDQLLNPAGDYAMGYVSIPKIDVKLAIYHGVGIEALEEGCGHVEGTSLPIGGKGTHSVLAAHRGLPSARLFTDLDQMEIGDVFYITVLNETLAYRVDQITTVLPSELDDLAIDENEDYVTLLTCTPYGINTHRLLVRGSRTEYTEEEIERIEEMNNVMNIPYVRMLLCGLGAVILAVIVLWIGLGRRRKEKKV